MRGEKSNAKVFDFKIRYDENCYFIEDVFVLEI